MICNVCAVREATIPVDYDFWVCDVCEEKEQERQKEKKQ